jgi:hypothetical protein
MHRPKRPLLLAFAALGLTAGTGIPVAMRERGYWADKPLPIRPLASRFTLADARRLWPGEYRWASYANDPSPISIAIDLTSQRAYVFQGQALVGIAAISSGRRGHGTPTGAFPILEKARYHRSNIYSNAPMPFMQRLTWGGIALHAGYNPGRPASHGCIRLPYGFARILFQATRVGGTVVVMRAPPIVAPSPIIEAPDLQMASAEPDHATPLTPDKRVAVMSTDKTIAYVTATML